MTCEGRAGATLHWLSSPPVMLGLLLAAHLGWAAGFAVLAATRSWWLFAVVGPGLALPLLFDRRQWRLLRGGGRAALIGLAAGTAHVLATHGGYLLLREMAPALRERVAVLYGLLYAPAQAPFTRGLLLLCIAASEEVIFRGAWLGTRHPRESEGTGGGWTPAWWPTSRLGLAALAYGLTALPLGSLLLVAWTALCGLFWGLLRLHTGSLWPALLAHLLWDLAILLLWPLPV